MSGEWVPAETYWREAEARGVNIWPEQRQGHAYGGLIIVMGYDIGWEGFDEHYWDIWYHKTGRCLVSMHGSLEEAMEMGDDIAAMADWTLIEKVDWDKFAILDLNLRAYIGAHPEIDFDHHGTVLARWDQIVPYGDDADTQPRMF